LQWRNLGNISCRKFGDQKTKRNIAFSHFEKKSSQLDKSSQEKKQG
jgi:hypothetical protein